MKFIKILGSVLVIIGWASLAIDLNKEIDRLIGINHSAMGTIASMCFTIFFWRIVSPIYKKKVKSNANS